MNGLILALACALAFALGFLLGLWKQWQRLVSDPPGGPARAVAVGKKTVIILTLPADLEQQFVHRAVREHVCAAVRTAMVACRE